MSYEHILFEVNDGVAVVTLNRPEQLNAWTATMSAELSDALTRCQNDDAVRVIVITGAGGRAFCAGADLGRGGGTFAGRDDSGARKTGGAQTAGGARETSGAREPSESQPVFPHQVDKPVIAAINGHAVGVGITYPMLADIRFIAEDAKVAFAFVRRGVLPELASHVTVARVAGFSNAADLLLSGRTIRGAEAAAMGLASRALPAGEVLEAAMELAGDMARHTAPASVAAAKRLLWEGVTASVPEMMKREGPLFSWFGNQPDAREGVMSFVEKRDPAWSMSARDVPDDLLGGSRGR